MEAGLPISTSYRYLHEPIDVIAEQAPDLHDVLDQAKREGWSHVTLDATLVEIDRVNERTEVGHHRWYSGKHKTQGGNVQILADPAGFPVWSSEVEPGSTHDITAARMHCLGVLYKAAGEGLPTLADQGYEGSGIGVHTPVKGRDLDVANRSYNTLLTAVPAIGERANAELKGTLAMPSPSPPVPEQNRPDRRSRGRTINPAKGTLLRKPQCNGVGFIVRHWRPLTGRTENPRSSR